MRIWHFGDTHGNHRQLEVPKNIDIVIFSGDAGTYRDPYMNDPVVRGFIEWFYGLDIPHKVMIAGNHDSSIEQRLVSREDMKRRGIVYLENEYIIIDEIKIWGSPYTPTFGDWSFMKARHKLDRVWDMIPNDTDILVTHGPPKGVLDIASSYQGYEFCGCANLFKQVTERIKPKLHLFGHIHDADSRSYHNAGIMQIPNCDTWFSNGSVCRDGQMNRICYTGNVIEYDI